MISQFVTMLGSRGMSLRLTSCALGMGLRSTS